MASNFYLEDVLQIAECSPRRIIQEARRSYPKGMIPEDSTIVLVHDGSAFVDLEYILVFNNIGELLGMLPSFTNKIVVVPFALKDFESICNSHDRNADYRITTGPFPDDEYKIFTYTPRPVVTMLSHNKLSAKQPPPPYT